MPEAVHVASGKIREIYEVDAETLLVASDRISTFDVVLPTEVPDKGRVLTGLSGFWFARTRGNAFPNHLLALRADGRSTEARRLEMLPIECVVGATLPGQDGRTTSEAAKSAGTSCRAGSASRTSCRRRSSRLRRRRRRTRREHRPGARGGALARSCSPRPACLARALRSRSRVRA